MKRDFHGFYKPNNQEFNTLWNDAIIIVDANVLLNLYTYSQSTAEEILSLLEKFGDRIWLPHQVAAEYHKNRCGIILKESKKYTEIVKELEAVGAALRTRKRHPYITPELAQRFDQVETDLKKELNDGERKHRELISSDIICNKITELFDGRVGEATKEEKLKDIYKEGSNRYVKKIPPGYSDVKKPEYDRYGDLVLWHQLMEHATACKKPVLFVTDDLKEDWWAFSGNDRLGPRPELRHEFRAKTGHDFYIYSTDTFVDTANKQGKQLSEMAAEEIENASKERQQDVAADRARGWFSRDSLKEHLKLQEVMRQFACYPIEDYRKQQEILDQLSLDPLDEYRKQQKILDQLSLDPLDEYRKQQKILDQLSRDPLDEYRKQQKILDQLSRDPLDEYRKLIDVVKDQESDNNETDMRPPKGTTKDPDEDSDDKV